MSEPSQPTTGSNQPAPTKSKKQSYWKKRKAAQKRARKEREAVEASTAGEQKAPVADLPPVRIDGPLQEFFDQYLPSFVYNPRRSAHDECRRLIKEHETARSDRKGTYWTFWKALVDQFHYRYGTDVNSLASWQAICATLKVDPLPDNLKEAREAVCNRHVNLVDLTTAYEDIRDATVFETEVDLSKYTQRTGQKFSRRAVGNGTILYMLLRLIDNPPPADTRRDENNRIVVPGAMQESQEKPKKKRRRNKKKKTATEPQAVDEA